MFSAEGKPLLEFGQFGTEEDSFGLPNGIALGPDNSLWVVDSGNNRLERFSKIQP